MSQQETEERPPAKPEDQSEGEDQANAKVNTHQLFLKVKQSRKRRKAATGFQEFGERMDKIALEQDQLATLREIKDLVDRLIDKKRELLQNDGVTI
jgi:hypothetical protein